MAPRRPFVFCALLSAVLICPATAADADAPPKDREPVLQIDPGGPAAYVTGLAFSPDGQTLYTAGWDKVVRLWRRNDKGHFEPARTAFRVPVGPGTNGALNALALSADGAWLAAAGNGMARLTAGFRDSGMIVPSSGLRDPEALRDVGSIYLFHTSNRTVRTLRGHRGAVRSLAFGAPRGKAPPLLLSAAEEGSEGSDKQLTARVWDTDKGTSRELKGLPIAKLFDGRPGVALMPGERAALALFDGKLRLWDTVNNGEAAREVEDLPRNLGVAAVPGGDKLVTSGYDPDLRQSRLALWQVPARGEAKQLRRASIGDGFARAVAVLPRKAGGPADLAAIVLLRPGAANRPNQYLLRLIDLRAEQFGETLAEELVWEEKERLQPVVAASPRGDTLAIAGNQGHTVRIYAVGPLLRKENAAPQILKGQALVFRHASFVRRGADLGLLLNPQRRKKHGEAPPQPDDKRGDQIFDFARRRLTGRLAGWQTVAPEAGAWRAEPIAGERALGIFEGERRIGKVVIPAKEVVTDYALLPPGKSSSVPLVAIASHLNGQPRLAIYHGGSGEQIREFTGPTEPLRALAFAPDGRLLVSAADDGTVCVWSLTDLDTVRGRRGRLAGVAIESAGQGVRVRRVDPDSPAIDKLKAGDRIAGVVENGSLRPLDSPRAFYEAVYRLRPGSKIVLRRGDPDGADDVTLTVGQGIDERKPLFSLFAVRPPGAAEVEWIGWSPVGPYEASGPPAEKYLGWHFNTGDPAAPTRFADAGQYRKFYYREGLLGRLLARGALGRVELPHLPPPSLGLWAEEDGRTLPGGLDAPVVARRPTVDLKVAVLERPLSSLSSLSWRLDDGAETPMELDRAEEATFRVPLTLSRGEHRLVVTARTRDASAPPVHSSLIVSYRPRPPVVAHEDAGGQPRVRAAKYVLKADLTPAAPGEDLLVTVRHRHGDGEEKPYTRTFAARDVVAGKPLRLDHELNLHPGNNDVEVVAVNGGAGDGDREAETGRLKLPIFYYFKARPPAIVFRRVVPVSGKGDGAALTADPSRPIVVHTPAVKLTGTLASDDEPLSLAEWDHGKSTPSARLERFEPGAGAEFAFTERITLAKGVQSIRLRARTKNSEAVERGLTLHYQPPLPVVTSLTEPVAGAILDGRDATRAIAVRGRIRVPEAATDYRAEILVNGRPASEPAVLDAKTGTLSGTAVLGPGDNRIQVRLSNPWGASTAGEVVLVHYVRPPYFVGEPETTPVAGRPLVDLKTDVVSPTPLRRDSVRVEVNGVESAPADVRIDAGAKDRWTLHLAGVLLDAGSPEQRIAVRLSNAEAECRAPAVRTVRSAQVFPPPDAEFLEPRRDVAVSVPRLTVRFQVRSGGKLERVRLLRGDRPPLPIDLEGVRQEGGTSELTATKEIELEPGPNRLSIEAVGVGGRLPDGPQLVLNYVPPPLRVEVAGLSATRTGGPTIRPNRHDGGTLVFPESATGRVWLHGHIAWADAGDGWRDDYFLLRVFVNGFQQLPFEVQRKSNQKETPFRVQLLLNRRHGNRVSLLASRHDAGGPAECRLDCAQPVAGQRLHVLALSPHSQPDEVRARLLAAVRARHDEDGSAKTFKEPPDVLVPLTGNRVSPEFLRTRMAQLKDAIRARQRAAGPTGSPVNDVLMIYYEGGERIDDRGHFFETYSRSGAAFGMPCDKMVGCLGDVPGAHVLLLDVERSADSDAERPRDHIARWEDDYPDARAHIVVMRCARRGEPGRRGQVRLIPVLQRTLPQSGRLGKLMALVEEAIAASNDRELLVFTKYLPTELVDLVVGQPLP